mgnify:CR=1 FL=1
MEILNLYAEECLSVMKCTKNISEYSKLAYSSDLKDFIKCYNADDISKRVETWSEENPNGRYIPLEEMTEEEFLKVITHYFSYYGNYGLDITPFMTEEEKELLRQANFITVKPVIYAANIDEDSDDINP